MKFSFRIDNIEVRSCNKHLMSDGLHDSFEIVKHARNECKANFCYTIAYSRDTKDSYEVILIPDRSKEISAEILMDLLLKACQEKNKW